MDGNIATGLRLYSGPLSMFGAKAEIAAREKGLDFELVMMPFDMQRLYDPKQRHGELPRLHRPPRAGVRDGRDVAQRARCSVPPPNGRGAPVVRGKVMGRPSSVRSAR